MAHPVIHFEIGGHDAEKLQTFYSDLFGWTTTPAGPGYWLVPPQNGGIGGGFIETTRDMPTHVTIYVEVDDLDAALQRAAELGGKAIVPPTDIPGVGAFALFTDPEGNAIGLLRMSEP